MAGAVIDEMDDLLAQIRHGIHVDLAVIRRTAQSPAVIASMWKGTT